jgi:acyl carrier protein
VWLDWDALGRDPLAAVRTRLAETTEPLGVRGVANARLAREHALHAWLTDEAAYDSLDAVQELSVPPCATPDDLAGLAAALGTTLRLDWTEPRDGAFDAVFNVPEGAVVAPCVAPAASWRAYGNDPMQAAFSRRLVPELQEHLAHRLPDFMVPQQFAVLDALPLTPNGKVDRAALPSIEAERPAAAPDYVPPASAVEGAMAGLWSELLGVPRVGAHDDFFALGGHSLLATQLVSRIRTEFGAEVTLRQFFAAPTVTGVCALLPAREGAPAAESGIASGVLSEEEELLQRLDHLSEDELDSLLQKLRRGEAG